MRPQSYLDLPESDLVRPSGKTLHMMLDFAFRIAMDRDFDSGQVLEVDKALHYTNADSVPEEPFLLKILKSRLAWAGGEYSTPAILYAACGCMTPADCVQTAYALWLKSKDGPVTLSVLMEETNFGLGFPSQEAKHRLWDAQKSPGAPLGNLLDDPAVWDKPDGERDPGVWPDGI